MKAECDLHGPCDKFAERLWKNGHFEPATKWCPSRLYVGHLLWRVCPDCKCAIPSPVIEKWDFEALIPPREPRVVIPPQLDPRLFDQDGDSDE